MRNPTAAPAVVNCTMMLVAVFEKPSNCGTPEHITQNQHSVPGTESAKHLCFSGT